MKKIFIKRLNLCSSSDIGMSLIEVLFSISIIAIAISIGYYSLGIVSNSKNAIVKSDLDTLNRSVMLYRHSGMNFNDISSASSGSPTPSGSTTSSRASALGSSTVQIAEKEVFKKLKSFFGNPISSVGLTSGGLPADVNIEMLSDKELEDQKNIRIYWDPARNMFYAAGGKFGRLPQNYKTKPAIKYLTSNNPKLASSGSKIISILKSNKKFKFTSKGGWIWDVDSSNLKAAGKGLGDSDGKGHALYVDSSQLGSGSLAGGSGKSIKEDKVGKASTDAPLISPENDMFSYNKYESNFKIQITNINDLKIQELNEKKSLSDNEKKQLEQYEKLSSKNSDIFYAWTNQPTETTFENSNYIGKAEKINSPKWEKYSGVLSNSSEKEDVIPKWKEAYYGVTIASKIVEKSYNSLNPEESDTSISHYRLKLEDPIFYNMSIKTFDPDSKMSKDLSFDDFTNGIDTLVTATNSDKDAINHSKTENLCIRPYNILSNYNNIGHETTIKYKILTSTNGSDALSDYQLPKGELPNQIKIDPKAINTHKIADSNQLTGIQPTAPLITPTDPPGATIATFPANPPEINPSNLPSLAGKDLEYNNETSFLYQGSASVKKNGANYGNIYIFELDEANAGFKTKDHLKERILLINSYTQLKSYKKSLYKAIRSWLTVKKNASKKTISITKNSVRYDFESGYQIVKENPSDTGTHKDTNNDDSDDDSKDTDTGKIRKKDLYVLFDSRTKDVTEEDIAKDIYESIKNKFPVKKTPYKVESTWLINDDIDTSSSGGIPTELPYPGDIFFILKP